MKKYIFFLLLLVPMMCKAQFGSNQAAINFGRAVSLTYDGQKALVEGDDDEAYEAFHTAYYDLNYNEAAVFLGVMVELEMGLQGNHSLVRKLYTIAAQSGSANGRAALQRNNTTGFWPATSEMRKTFRNMCAAMINYSGSGGGMTFGGGSSSSSQYKCSGCNGTGKCTACGGTGKQTSTSYYTDGHTIVSNCPICRGTGNCGVCHGRGSI